MNARITHRYKFFTHAQVYQLGRFSPSFARLRRRKCLLLLDSNHVIYSGPCRILLLRDFRILYGMCLSHFWYVRNLLDFVCKIRYFNSLVNAYKGCMFFLKIAVVNRSALANLLLLSSMRPHPLPPRRHRDWLRLRALYWLSHDRDAPTDSSCRGKFEKAEFRIIFLHNFLT